MWTLGDSQGCVSPAQYTYIDTLGAQPYEGKIVFVDRGGCSFEEKAWNAQVLGAAAVAIINYEVST
jgi:hypothetical protein